MAIRGFIIAIEEYPVSTSLGTRLKDTYQDAESFREWLINKKKVDPQNILFCTGPSVKGRTAGSDRKAIIAELRKLVEVGKDSTEELYFYFSGHGFIYSDSPWEWQTDILVTSDFVALDESGEACLKLLEIQQRLWNSLGPGDHYYFVDACRNPVRAEDVQVFGLGIKFPSSVLGKSTIYTLYSTSQGVAAKVASGFTKLLFQGLNGHGRAKRWDGPRMYVTFEMLCDYLNQKLRQQEIDSVKKGPGKGYILEVIPVPDSHCDVIVDNAGPTDSFALTVTNALGPYSSYNFSGPSYQLSLKPYEYSLQMSHPMARVVQVEPVPSEPVDLYESCAVHFKMEEPEHLATPESDGIKKVRDGAKSATLELEGAPDREIRLEHIETGVVSRSLGTLKESVFPGTYQVEMREDGVLIEKRMLRLKPDEQLRVNLLDRPKSRVRESVFRIMPGSKMKGMVGFSETLGETANWDLGLWLSIMGASRIAVKPEHFRKLGQLPLASFKDIQKDGSVVYFLAGLEGLQGQIKVALSTDAKVQWQKPRQIEELDGICECVIRASEGPYLFSFKMPDRAALTFATYCLANRATLIVIAQEANGRTKMHQYLLPIYDNLQYMDPGVVGLLGYFLEKPLRVVKLMALAQSQFNRNRPVLPPEGYTQVNDAWDHLLYGKWLDPVMALIAAYEVFRRGNDTARQGLLKEVVPNMRRYFGRIPDVEVLAGMLDGKSKIGLKTKMPGRIRRPYAPPIMMDGLLMISEGKLHRLPLPYEKIDYSSSWTAWLGAVDGSPSQ